MLSVAEQAVQYTEATGLISYAWLLIAIPLLSAGFLLVSGKRADKWGHWLAVIASWTSFVLGAIMVFQLLGQPGDKRQMVATAFTWAHATGIELKASFLVDPLSLTFVMLVTFVGSLIHVYSVAYMADDPERRRFFAYLNLFIAAMLTLVLGDSYMMLFVGWEGVGLVSYLLIGFWNYVPEYATAAKKAFVMNRVGDVGLLLAMMTMFGIVGSVSYQSVLSDAQSGAMTTAQATAIGILLLVAACGKSAQFPLQAWLGDAMAGPTPVSALIHAATMVTAGVYLMVRSGAIYYAAPTAMLLVAIVGAFTLMFGAIIGCAKDDIKKVLAASTMSQVGYMMLGAGLGPIGWLFAIFHLVIHGFFKALLFLGAGSVMHGMNGQLNMRRFGALRKYMKITFWTFMMAWLSIMGIPGFSGYFSKDKIIERSFDPAVHGVAGAWILGLVALIGAGVTAFYMSRLFFMTFTGKARWTTAAEGDEVHPHESPALMTVPMIILAIFSAIFGAIMGPTNLFEKWLNPSLVAGVHVEEAAPVMPVWAMQALTLALVILSIVIAWYKYGKADVPKYQPRGNFLTVAARRDLYQDVINENLFMLPGLALMRVFGVIDKDVVDGIVRGSAWATRGLGRGLAITQNGYIRTYAAYIGIGVLTCLFTLLAIMLQFPA